VSQQDIAVGSGSNLERGLGGMGHATAEERQGILTRARTAVASFKRAPARLAMGTQAPATIALQRPKAVRQLAQALLACVPHVPWASVEEAEAALASAEDDFWMEVSLLFVSAGKVFGVAAVSPVITNFGVSVFGALPSCREAALCGPWVQQLLGAFAGVDPIKHAAYDALHRPAFEAAGFLTTLTRQRLILPMYATELPPTVEVRNLTRDEIRQFLIRSKSTLDCSLEQVQEDSSFAVIRDGEVAGAILLADGPGKGRMTLELVWFDPKHRGTGGAAVLGNASMLAALKHHTTSYGAWEDVKNASVQLLNKRFDAKRDEPLRHFGWKIF